MMTLRIETTGSKVKIR